MTFFSFFQPCHVVLIHTVISERSFLCIASGITPHVASRAEHNIKLWTCVVDARTLFKLGTGMFCRRSPSRDVNVNMPAALTGNRSLSSLSWVRQLEVAIRATVGGGGDYSGELWLSAVGWSF